MAANQGGHGFRNAAARHRFRYALENTFEALGAES